MRFRFVKPIVSIFGTFEPGMVIDIPKSKITDSWLRNGIAHEVKGKAKGVKVRQTVPAPAKNKNTDNKVGRKK